MPNRNYLLKINISSKKQRLTQENNNRRHITSFISLKTAALKKKVMEKIMDEQRQQ